MENHQEIDAAHFSGDSSNSRKAPWQSPDTALGSNI